MIYTLVFEEAEIRGIEINTHERKAYDFKKQVADSIRAFGVIFLFSAEKGKVASVVDLFKFGHLHIFHDLTDLNLRF